MDGTGPMSLPASPSTPVLDKGYIEMPPTPAPALDETANLPAPSSARPQLKAVQHDSRYSEASEVISGYVSDDDENGFVVPGLTPHQKQYLSKMLAQLEMSKEWAAMGEVGQLAKYGKPFKDKVTIRNKKLAKQQKWPEPTEPPVLRFMFRHFALNFPGLREAPESFWTKSVQPTWDEVAAKHLPSSKERSEVTKRRMLAIMLTQYFGTVFHAGLKTTAVDSVPREAIRPLEEIRETIDNLFPPPQTYSVAGFYVFIPSVDLLTSKESGTRTPHYLICTRPDREDQRDIYVYRDYATFEKFDGDLASDGVSKPRLPLPKANGVANRFSLQHWLRRVLQIMVDHPDSVADRRIKQFLLGFAVNFSNDKLDALHMRVHESERIATEAHAKWVEAGEQVAARRQGWWDFKDGLVRGDGLREVFEVLKTEPSMFNLPKKYRHAEEWARSYFAYATQYLFVSSPNGAEIFYLIQILHHLFPYGIVQVLLKIVNPALMIKTVMALLLNSPPGTRSVFSRILRYIVTKDIKRYQKQVKSIARAAKDTNARKVLKHFFDLSAEQQDRIRASSREEGVDIVVAILTDVTSPLSKIEQNGIRAAHQAFVIGVLDGDTILLADNEVKSKSGILADKFKLLKRILRLYALIRGREQAIELWSNTLERFLVDSISLYYPVISAISKASNLPDRLADLKKFIDDLVETVLTTKRTATDFMDLSDRHHQALYYFCHEIHANGGKLTESLITFFKRGLDYMNKGVINQNKQTTAVDLEAILATRPSLAPKVMDEIDAVTKYVLYTKTRYEICMRADILGNKMKVDVDGLLHDVIYNEYDEDVIREGSSGSFGVTEWGYFYENQVIDNATGIILESPAVEAVDPRLTLAVADSEDVNSEATSILSGSVAPSANPSFLGAVGRAGSVLSRNGSVLGRQPGSINGSTHVQPRKPGRGILTLKPPVLVETRKLLPAYVAQIAPQLNAIAEREAWIKRRK